MNYKIILLFLLLPTTIFSSQYKKIDYKAKGKTKYDRNATLRPGGSMNMILPTSYQTNKELQSQYEQQALSSSIVQPAYNPTHTNNIQQLHLAQETAGTSSDTSTCCDCCSNPEDDALRKCCRVMCCTCIFLTVGVSLGVALG